MNMILIEFTIKKINKKKKKGNNNCATSIIAIVTVWYLFSLVFEEYTWRSYFDSYLFCLLSMFAVIPALIRLTQVQIVTIGRGDNY